MLIVNILFRDQPAVETLDLVNVRLILASNSQFIES